MQKARRQVTEKLKQIDVVLELVDARIPHSSRNPMIDELATGKPRLLLLNKADMADPGVTEKWQTYFKEQGIEECLTLNSQTGQGTDEIVPAAEHLMRDMHEKMRQKGMNPRAIRALILGIPNVGKSTLINRLAGKRITKVGDRPGITKQQQWIKVKGRVQLLDTPGILWPKFEDEMTGMRLAATGAIRNEVFIFQDVAFFVLRYLKKLYPESLQTRYKLDEIPEEDLALYDEIARKRGCIMRGGEIDYDKAGALILRDLQTGKIGRISLENPAEFDN